VISGKAHKKVMKTARPGLYEYHLESVFRNVVSYEGCRHFAYTPIVASGPNSCILHYGHAGAPNDRRLENGDLCLCDMGAEYYCYASDITCTFPVNGEFTPEQRVIFDAVSAANKQMCTLTKIGQNWLDNHRMAESIILTHLRDYGMLKGDVDDMMKVHLGAVFMPHGVGHFLGLEPHDVGGYPEGTSRLKEPGVRSLRTTRTLEKNMVITAEPGCYFIDKVYSMYLSECCQM
jgi:Xaa-Pro dipeptidase